MKPNELTTFFVIDTETTGFNVEKNDAIEVSAVKVEKTNSGFKILEQFDSYIDPKYPLPDAIVKFNEENHTGINDELLSIAPDASKVAKELRAFMGDDPIVVGHNVKFDIKFINKLYSNIWRKFTPKDSIDTLAIAREKETGSHKLADMFQKSNKIYSESVPNFHNSLADCYATLDVLDYLIDNYFETQEIKFEEFTPANRRTSEQEKKEEIKNWYQNKLEEIWSVSDLAFLTGCNINGIVAGFDNIGNIKHGKIAIDLPDGVIKTDLLEFTNQIISDKKTNAILINKNDSGSIEVTGYVYKNKIGAYPIESKVFGKLNSKEDVLDFTILLDDTIENIQKYRPDMAKKSNKER